MLDMILETVMQTPIKETEVVVDLHKYRTKRKQARYYWSMTKCSYVRLSQYMKVPLPIARKWELAFTKEYQQRKKNNGR